MVKRSFARISGFVSAFILVATGIPLYTHQTIASISMEFHPYSPDAAKYLQPLEECDKTTYEIDQSRLWGSIHFPTDGYEGLELGRKIGNWIAGKLAKCTELSH